MIVFLLDTPVLNNTNQSSLFPVVIGQAVVLQRCTVSLGTSRLPPHGFCLSSIILPCQTLKSWRRTSTLQLISRSTIRHLTLANADNSCGDWSMSQPYIIPPMACRNAASFGQLFDGSNTCSRLQLYLPYSIRHISLGNLATQYPAEAISRKRVKRSWLRT